MLLFACRYDEAYRLYTTDDAKADFPRGPDREGSDGQMYPEGLIYIRGAADRGARMSVGDGNMRVMHPQGVLPALTLVTFVLPVHLCFPFCAPAHAFQ